jgi:hypothetical protein
MNRKSTANTRGILAQASTIARQKRRRQARIAAEFMVE